MQCRSTKPAAAAAQHLLENALIVWKFESVVRRLDTQTALETEHMEAPLQPDSEPRADSGTVVPPEHAMEMGNDVSAAVEVAVDKTGDLHAAENLHANDPEHIPQQK